MYRLRIESKYVLCELRVLSCYKHKGRIYTLMDIWPLRECYTEGWAGIQRTLYAGNWVKPWLDMLDDKNNNWTGTSLFNFYITTNVETMYCVQWINLQLHSWWHIGDHNSLVQVSQDLWITMNLTYTRLLYTILFCGKGS